MSGGSDNERAPNIISWFAVLAEISGWSRRSSHPKVLGALLAAVGHNVIDHMLIFVERVEPGALNRRDVNEHVPDLHSCRTNTLIPLGA